MKWPFSHAQYICECGRTDEFVMMAAGPPQLEIPCTKCGRTLKLIGRELLQEETGMDMTEFYKLSYEERLHLQATCEHNETTLAEVRWRGEKEYWKDVVVKVCTKCFKVL